jgi:hypothetical protein
MARGRYPFWTHDTVAAAVLAGVGMASLQSKLDGLASEWNIPVVTALVHGWPMVALFVFLVLLIMHSVNRAEIAGSKNNGDPNKDEMKHETAIAGSVRSELDEAVGEGLESMEGLADIEEATWCEEVEFR